jgi:hypothetical protein
MKALVSVIFALSLMASAGSALGQREGKQPPAKQSAPAESTDAAGHDVQGGQPETAEKTNGEPRAKKKTQTKDTTPSK